MLFFQHNCVFQQNLELRDIIHGPGHDLQGSEFFNGYRAPLRVYATQNVILTAIVVDQFPSARLAVLEIYAGGHSRRPWEYRSRSQLSSGFLDAWNR